MSKNFEKICKELQECKQQIKPKSIPEIFGIQHKEVYITQWIGYLLDPNKNGLGIDPLNALLRAGGFAGISEKVNLKDIKIYTEYVFGNNRRIDIFIETPECLIGIENKIWSDEQVDQTKDYEESLNKMTGDPEKVRSIYLYPEQNKNVHPVESFHRVTYKQLHNELKKISVKDSVDRDQWILNEFIKYVEENLMKFQSLTPMGKLYAAYRSDIEKAAKEYIDYVAYIAEQMKNKIEAAGFKLKKICDTVYQIDPITVANQFNFHFEIQFCSDEILLLIHLEKSGSSSEGFKAAQVYFSQNAEITDENEWKIDRNTCTIAEKSFDIDFKSESDLNRELDLIVDEMKSKEFQKWAKIAVEYSNCEF